MLTSIINLTLLIETLNWMHSNSRYEPFVLLELPRLLLSSLVVLASVLTSLLSVELVVFQTVTVAVIVEAEIAQTAGIAVHFVGPRTVAIVAR